MYSIEINFLDDRPEYNPEMFETSAGPSAPPISIEGQTALVIGGAVAATALALVGGAWFYLTQISIPQLEARQRDLDSELAVYLQKENELQALNDETSQITGQTESLAGVFNFVTPWSAVLQDLRDRTPPGVRINGIAQSEPKPGGAAAAAPPEGETAEGTTSIVVISGIASSFSEVSDLLVVLQQSSFFDGSATRLLRSEMEDNPGKVIQASETQFRGELEPVVTFEIETKLDRVAASSILGELEAKGATGLVSRIRRLQTRGVIE
ncbi:MAG: fimbrial assembly protein [Coleofasciculaceae cyanobacterium RL_1_1]|nr:fimbrial assembly protein [Coleofasciculaceae cyanobacterium RL_1_1]